VEKRVILDLEVSSRSKTDVERMRAERCRRTNSRGKKTE
jgi:hypothetical protein